MNQPSLPSDPEKEQRLHAIIAEYLKRKDAGKAVNKGSLIKAYPDLADGLRSWFQGEELIDGRAPEFAPTKMMPKPLPSVNRETVRPATLHADTTSEFSGRQFGRYPILRPLGEGAMGNVYLALDTALDRHVALKIPKTEGAANAEFMARFTREARAAAALNHSNICKVYDAGEYEGTAYITMDYIDGVPLSRFIGSQKLQSVDSVLQMIKTIAEAVSHAHSKGIIHRDLKPGNILVDAEFTPHVTDFGLARRFGETSDESRITQEGLLIGTPAYMAPEQVKGEQSKICPQSDVYSLGVVLFELLTSRLPFEGKIPEMLAKVLRDSPPVPSHLRKDLSEGVDDICLKMLQKNPTHRYSTMEDLIAAITKLPRKPQTSAISAADAARSQSPFEIQKAHVELMLKKGQYAAAIQDLEKLAKEKAPGAKAVAEWARTKLTVARAESKALSPAGLAALLQTGQQLFEKSDYSGCIQLLDDVPSLRRTEAMEELLREARKRETDADQLLLEIKDKERRQETEGLEHLVRRFLKLKPGNAYAKRLWEALNTYSKTPPTRRNYRFEKGRLQPTQEPGFLRQWAILGSLVGVLVFLSVYAYVAHYLKNASPSREANESAISRTNANIEKPLNPKMAFGNFTPPLAVAPFDEVTAKSHQKAWADFVKEPVEYTNSAGMKLNLIPAGEFIMGSPDNENGRRASEGPQHQVRLTQPIYMSKTEVTQGAWFKIMGTKPWHAAVFSFAPIKDGDDYAVTGIDRHDALKFCRKLGETERQHYRLPTEAEWEFSCRGGTQSAFGFGDDFGELKEYAWYNENSNDIGNKYPQIVGLKTPNTFGLHDMHGNVWEWCHDVYADATYAARTGTTNDPVSLGGSGMTVLRGGCWLRDARNARAANRNRSNPDSHFNIYGMRVVRIIDNRVDVPLTSLDYRYLGIASFDAGEKASAQSHFQSMVATDSSIDNLYYLALVHLSIGDEVQYRHVCSQMYQTISDRSGAFELNSVVWYCCVGEDSGIATSALVDWSKKSVASIGEAEPNRSIVMNTLAAALYRNGQLDEAKKTVEQSISMQNGEGFAEDALILAIVNARLGEFLEAEVWLSKSKQIADTAKDRPGVSWADRLCRQLLRDEALAVIKSKR